VIHLFASTALAGRPPLAGLVVLVACGASAACGGSTATIDAGTGAIDAGAIDASMSGTIDAASDVDGGVADDAGRGDAFFAGDAGACGGTRPRLLLPFDLPDVRWFLAGHVDLDPAVGERRDYGGGIGDAAFAADGATGTTFRIAHFELMRAGVDVLAATAGTVTEVVDGFDDENVEVTDGCGMRENRVTIRSPDGTTIAYQRVANGSISVSVGEEVAAGTVIARMGSSGCSVWPGLRLEIRDCVGAVIAPFDADMFEPGEVPPYDDGAALVTAIRHVGFFPDPILPPLREPAPEITTVAPSDLFALLFLLRGGRPGQTCIIRFLDPSGTEAQRAEVNFDPQTLWSAWQYGWNVFDAGEWRVTLEIDGAVVYDEPFTVPMTLPP
jgi:hypothetical protein